MCSVGIPEKHFPFTASCPSVRTFRHALSLDERRVKFKADHHDASGLHKTDVKEVWFAGCHAGEVDLAYSFCVMNAEA